MWSSKSVSSKKKKKKGMYSYKHSWNKPDLVGKCYSTTPGVHGSSLTPLSFSSAVAEVPWRRREAPRETGRLGWDGDEKPTLHAHGLTLSVLGKPGMGGFVLLSGYTSSDPLILDFYPLWDEPSLCCGQFWGLACCGFLSPPVVLSTLQQLFLPCSSKSKCSSCYLKLATLFP